MGNGKVYQCLTCMTTFDKTQPPCPYCGEPTCFECRTKEGQHDHDQADKTRYCFGWCPVSQTVEGLLHRDGAYRCAKCDFEWAPRAIKSWSSPGDYICPFCGALQSSIIFPFCCGRCAMELR